ncbi:hypothetical protein [Shinella zoogloeoides]|uniref:hypothetical protein n=1 Tax=Shinella zoogloeoides TaxID=352475 RepID=UPI0028A70B9C|nr:hypothetical protein [Shinella zoogloeoides]
MSKGRLYYFRGKHMTRADVALLTGLSPNAITLRINGDVIEDRPFVPREHRRDGAAKRYRFRGEMKTAKEIAAITGLAQPTVYGRMSGDTFLEHDDARPLYDLPTNSVPVFYRGETMSISAWARKLGIPVATLQWRLSYGWSVKRALSEPVMPPNARRRYRRNAEIIRRMLQGFSNTGGYSQTFTKPKGTGVGRHVLHLQSEKELSP